MQSIRTLEATEYQGCNVYVRNFGSIFEYLVIIDGQLYTMHIVVTKPLWQTLFGVDYTKKQLASTTAYLMNTAKTTVEYVLNEKMKKK